MFTTHPLTWLFVLATIAVDIVMLALGSEAWEYSKIASGFVLGQVASLSIWTVRGSAHRLLRASILVLVIGVLVQNWSGLNKAIVTAVFFFYSLLILFITACARLAKYFSLTESQRIEQRKKIRIPIIEFFGWSIVVATISLGIRYMDVSMLLESNAFWLHHLILLVIPAIVALGIQKDLRDFNSYKALILVIAVVALEILFHDFTGYFLITSQAAYLVAWLIVFTLDNIRAEAIQVEIALQDEAPKLYDPQ